MAAVTSSTGGFRWWGAAAAPRGRSGRRSGVAPGARGGRQAAGDMTGTAGLADPEPGAPFVALTVGVMLTRTEAVVGEGTSERAAAEAKSRDREDRRRIRPPVAVVGAERQSAIAAIAAIAATVAGSIPRAALLRQVELGAQHLGALGRCRGGGLC